MQDALRIVEKAGEAIALSTRRIFNNKGAKAQAKQIYAQTSINRVYNVKTRR